MEKMKEKRELMKKVRQEKALKVERQRKEKRELAALRKLEKEKNKKVMDSDSEDDPVLERELIAQMNMSDEEIEMEESVSDVCKGCKEKGETESELYSSRLLARPVMLGGTHAAHEQHVGLLLKS